MLIIIGHLTFNQKGKKIYPAYPNHVLADSKHFIYMRMYEENM